MRWHRARTAVLCLVALAAAGCSSSTPGTPEADVSFSAAPRSAAPPVASEGATFRAAVLGDFGTAGEFEHLVSLEMQRWFEAMPFDALITTGDNVYPDGDPGYFEGAWTEPYAWALEMDVEVVASLGNHDIETDDGEPVMELLEMPARWYRERIEEVDIFILDANDPNDPDQTRWLKRASARSSAAWQIVAFHQPPFSCSDHGNEEEVQEAWVTMFERHGVDLVLSGHDHNYQRFEGPSGVPYVVSGGGGANLYAIGECSEEHPPRPVAAEEHHFVMLEVTREGLRLRAIAPEGAVLDDVMIEQRR